MEKESVPLVHPKLTPPAALKPLAFLVGSFEGRGRVGLDRKPMSKRVVGRWIGGSQHLLLEMEADYPLDDGRIDRHAAAVVVSARGKLVEARVFPDGGSVRTVELADDSGRWAFDDVPPHGLGHVSATKRLVARDAGWVETLHVRGEDGRETQWSEVVLAASLR